MCLFADEKIIIPEAKSEPNFMEVENVQKRFGNRKFNAKLFRAGSLSLKASMVADIIKSKYYIGKSRSQVQSDLGEPSGYYISETFLAYIVHIKKNDSQEVWQLLFIPDRSGRITDVKMHNQVEKTKELK